MYFRELTNVLGKEMYKFVNPNVGQQLLYENYSLNFLGYFTYMLFLCYVAYADGLTIPVITAYCVKYVKFL